MTAIGVDFTTIAELILRMFGGGRLSLEPESRTMQPIRTCVRTKGLSRSGPASVPPGGSIRAHSRLMNSVGGPSWPLVLPPKPVEPCRTGSEPAGDALAAGRPETHPIRAAN